MLKTTIKVLLFSVVILAGLWFMGLKDLLLLKPSSETVESPEIPGNPGTLPQNEGPGQNEKSSNALTLAFKDINLFQAEKNGFTLWRLQATWANMEEVNGLIKVESPALKYFMVDGDVVIITAKKGDIDQDEKILRFMEDVRLVNKTNILTGNLLVYANDMMVMPEGGVFNGAGMSGSADSIQWQIKDDTITAEGHVVAVFGES